MGDIGHVSTSIKNLIIRNSFECGAFEFCYKKIMW